MSSVMQRSLAQVVEAHGITIQQYNVLRILRGAGDAGLPTLAIRDRMVEEAAAFDELTRSGRDKELMNQTSGGWPNTFRSGRFIPAVDYLMANRVRALAMQKWNRSMSSSLQRVARSSSPRT